MTEQIETERLQLRLLAAEDAAFVIDLVNSPGWLRYIGDRHIHTLEDALGYVDRIQRAASITYWVVRLKEDLAPIGIITLIKRDYLDHFDIGFAFLPAFGGKGFAYEATKEVLSTLQRDPMYQHLYAVLLPSNERSIRLLSRLGFTYLQDVEVSGQNLAVYTN